MTPTPPNTIICPDCGACTFDQIEVHNDGMSPATYKCKCGTAWSANQTVMVRGDLPSKKEYLA